MQLEMVDGSEDGLWCLSQSCQKVSQSLKNRLATADQLVEEYYGIPHVKYLLKETHKQRKNLLIGTDDG